MPDTVLVVSSDSATLLNDHAVQEQRWNAWQKRGFVRDARNRRRMGVLIAFVVLAFAGLFGRIVFGAS